MSGMTQAWLARDMQRQEFVERTVRNIREAEGDQPAGWLFEVAGLIIFYLGTQQAVSPLMDAYRFWITVPAAANTAYLCFAETVLNPAIEFSRSSAELSAMLLRIVQGLTEACGFRINGDLRTEELLNPAGIFQAETAMTEVPIPEVGR